MALNCMWDTCCVVLQKLKRENALGGEKLAVDLSSNTREASVNNSTY